MHIVVCIKQVPDSAQIRVHPVTNTIMRQGVPTIINPYDLFALEEALRLRDRLGGEVTVLDHGAANRRGQPAQGADLRRRPCACCHRPVLRRFGHAGDLFALASAIGKIAETFGAPDIIFAGKQTIDGDTAQVGPASPSGSISCSSPMCRRSAPSIRTAAARGRAARRGRHTGARHAAPLPRHHAGRLQRDCAAAPWPTRSAPPAPRSSPGAPRTPASRTSPNAPARLATVVKRVFAPAARSEKATQIEINKPTAAKPPTT